MSDAADSREPELVAEGLRAPHRNPFGPAPDLPAFSACAAELKRAFREQRTPALATHKVSQWAGALDLLLLSGRLDVAEHAARHLHAFEPGLPYARNLCAFFDRLPPADGSQLPFQDDRRSEVQVVRREGSDTALLVFCDGIHRFGMPLMMMHRWLGRVRASLIYLRDVRRLYYLSGIPGLAPTRRKTLAALRALVSSLGAQRIVCCGSSAGVFGALHYGVDLAADAVLALGGPTSVAAEFNTHLRTRAAVERLHKALPGSAVDLRGLYAAAVRAPRARVLYGDGDWDDRLHASHLSGLPAVQIEAVADCEHHNVAMVLAGRGRLEALLEWLLAV